MLSRKPIISYIVFTLAAIGFLMQISKGSNVLLLGIIVFGLVFLLYKFPPNRWTATAKRFSIRNNKKNKRKFHVIDGRKKDGNDPPPYH